MSIFSDPPQSPTPDTTDLVVVLTKQLQVATERADRLDVVLLEATRQAAAAESAATAAREATARKVRQLEQVEAALKAAQTQRDAALAARDATQAELTIRTAGGPLARAWRGFWRGR
jgi:Fic family protein